MPGHAALLNLVNAHFIGNGPYPLQLVCMTEDASGAECDETIAEVEPGTGWDELETLIAAHGARYHAATVPAELQPAPELTAAMRETRHLRELVAEICDTLASQKYPAARLAPWRQRAGIGAGK